MSKAEVKVKKKGLYDKGVLAVSEKFMRHFRWILLGLLMIIVFYPPYVRGLYFEAEQLPAEIFIFIVFAAFWIYKYFKKDRVFIKTPLEYAALGFTIVYLISIFAAVSTRSAIAEWLKYCMYFVVFYMISQLCNTDRSRMLALWTIVASSIGVCILGIDGVAGNGIATNLNGILKSMGASRDIFFGLFVEGRINSTIQYPNALAAYVLAVYVLTIGLTVVSKKLIAQVAYSICSFILLLTFIFTYSRGAYILYPFVLLIFVFSMPKGSRVRGSAYIISSLISVGCIYAVFSNVIAKGTANTYNIWLTLLYGVIASIVLCVIVRITVRPFERIKWYIYATFCGSVIIFAIVCSIYISNVSLPVEVSHVIGEKDGVKSFTREISIEPGKEYKLQVDIETESKTKDVPWYYQIEVNSKSEGNILFGGNTKIATLQGKNPSEHGIKEIKFNVPPDSKLTELVLSNYAEDSKTKFGTLRIVDSHNPHNVKNVVLNYKYIPDSLENRFHNMLASESSLSRSIFYRDGIEIFKDNWFIGAGGGAWPYLYFSYQSYLYWTTQAHNYILQLAVESGVLGLFAFMLLLFAILYSALRHFVYKNYIDTQESVIKGSLFTAICAMLMHSVVDFDLSLSAIFLMLWALIAIFNSFGENESRELTNLKDNRLYRVLLVISTKIKFPTVNVIPVIGLIVTLIVIVLPIKFDMGLAYQKEASTALQTNNIQATLKSLEKAISIDNFADQYKLDYAYYLIQQGPNKVQQKDLLEANKYVVSAEKSAKNSSDLAVKAGSFYFATGNIDKGLSFIDRAVELSPFNPAEWQSKAEAYFQATMYYLGKNDKSNYEKYLEKTIGLVDEAKVKNKKNIGNFAFNSDTSLILEKAYYLKQSAQNTSNINKLAFISLNDMDIKGDGIPDQWESFTSYDVFQTQSGKLKVKGKAGDVCGIISRNLNLRAGKSYKLEIKVAESSNLKKLNYMMYGMDTDYKELKKDDKIFNSDINVKNDFKNGENSKLILQIDGECEIEYIKIIEQ